jgi:hypothetical protein
LTKKSNSDYFWQICLLDFSKVFSTFIKPSRFIGNTNLIYT